MSDWIIAGGAPVAFAESLVGPGPPIFGDTLGIGIAAHCGSISIPASKREQAVSLEQYLPVILFILVGCGVGIAPQVLGFLAGPRRPDAAKNSPYECGFEAFEDARMKFDVRYYLVAILFILFDLEIAFLFPWAVSLREIGPEGFWAMMIFLGILVVGFAYDRQ